MQLEKLGTLIKRNPKATFMIEGYTDSFGPFDYNLDLSQRRAESVTSVSRRCDGNQSGAIYDMRRRRVANFLSGAATYTGSRYGVYLDSRYS